MTVYQYPEWKEVEDVIKPAMRAMNFIKKHREFSAKFAIDDWIDEAEDKELKGCDVEHFIIGQVLKLKRKWLNEDRAKTRFIEPSFDAWAGGDVETTR